MLRQLKTYAKGLFSADKLRTYPTIDLTSIHSRKNQYFSPLFSTILWFQTAAKYYKLISGIGSFTIFLFDKAIAAARKAHKLNQDAIDGISDRHLRRIEVTRGDISSPSFQEGFREVGDLKLSFSPRIGGGGR